MNKKILYKALEIIHTKYEEFKSLFRYKITTNAVLLDPQTIGFLQEHNFNISISIDGDRSTHNLNRRSVDKRDVYDVIINNIQYLIERDIEFAVRMTVTANNVEKLYDNTLNFFNMGVKKVFYGINHIGEWSEEAYKEFDNQMFFIDSYYLNHVIKGKEKVLNIHDYKISTFVYAREPLYCSGGSNGHLIINSKGELYPCGYVSNNLTWKIGSVDTSLDRKKFIETARKNVQKKSSCKDCNIAFTCNGAKCGFLNYIHTGLLNCHDERTCRIQNILYRHNLPIMRTLYKMGHPRIMMFVEDAVVNKMKFGRDFQRITEEMNDNV